MVEEDIRKGKVRETWRRPVKLLRNHGTSWPDEIGLYEAKLAGLR